MPERRHLDFHDFDAVTADVENLHKRGYTKLGNWDLSQVCNHLAINMGTALEAGLGAIVEYTGKPDEHSVGGAIH